MKTPIDTEVVNISKYTSEKEIEDHHKGKDHEDEMIFLTPSNIY